MNGAEKWREDQSFQEWLASEEGCRIENDLDLAHCPELCRLLETSPVPGRILEMALARKTPARRKEKGVFFTPRPIALFMVGEAISAWRKIHPDPAALAKIRILDPACGAGEFLLAAFEILLELQNKFANGKSAAEWRRSIIENNLYGIDCDENALRVLRFRSRAFSGRPIPENHLKCGNSLQMPEAWRCFEDMEGGFDLVIGNPPYVSFGLRSTGKLSKAESAELRKKFPESAEYKISTYALFMELAVRSTKPDGIHSFIVPDSFLGGQYYTKIRKFLLENCIFEKIILLREKVFHATFGAVVIYFFRRGKPEENSTLSSVCAKHCSDLKNPGFAMRQSEFKKNFRARIRLFFDAATARRVHELENQAGCRLKDLLILASGLVGRYGQKSILSTIPRTDGDWRRGVISGKSLQPGVPVDWSSWYIHADPAVIKSGLGKIDYAREKIFFRQTGDRIVAAVDREGLLGLNNLHVGVPRCPGLDLDRLATYLNSDEMLFYYRAITLEEGRPLAQIDLETLRELPLPERFGAVPAAVVD